MFIYIVIINKVRGNWDATVHLYDGRCMVESVDYSGVIYEKRRPDIIKEKLNWSSKQIFRDLFCFS